MTSAHRRLLQLLAVLVASMMILAACGGDGDDPAAEGGPGDTSPPEDAEDEADRSAHFRFAVPAGHNSLDPHRSPSGVDAYWLRNIYDRLLTVVRTDEGAELAPQLATSWEVADDNLSVELELRDDVTFQDGTPFNGEAVRLNFERAKGPDSTVAGDLEMIDRVEVIDDTHIVIHLNEPDPAIAWRLASTTNGTMMVSPAAFDSDLDRSPVGSGPFTLVSAQKDADVVFERWDGHWDPDAALVQRLTISSVYDGNARFNGLRTGQYDAAYITEPQLQAQGRQDDQLQVLKRLVPSPYGMQLNNTMPPLDDVRVRRAIYKAIDRVAISEQLLDGLNPPVFQPFAPHVTGYDPALDEDPYDPEEARRLVQEAGAEGATLNVLQMAVPPMSTMAEVAQQALSEIGLRVELTPLSPTEFWPAWFRGDNHGMVAQIASQDEPSMTLVQQYLESPRHPSLPDDQLVAMAEAAELLPAGSDEQEEAYQEISRYLVENPMHVPIALFSNDFVAGPNVVGLQNMTADTSPTFRRVGLK